MHESYRGVVVRELLIDPSLHPTSERPFVNRFSYPATSRRIMLLSTASLAGLVLGVLTPISEASSVAVVGGLALFAGISSLWSP